MSLFNITALPFSTTEAVSVLEPLFILIVGIVIYSFFIFKFYRYLARKDVVSLNLSQYNNSVHPFGAKFLASIFYIVKYILVFPLMVFFWFLVLTLLLSFISQRPFNEILMVSMALVVAIRVTAYYNEDLSKDLAKMIPFALLGIYLVDVSLLTFGDFWRIFPQFMVMWKNVAYYLMLTMGLETILRLLSGFFSLFRKE